MKIRFVGGKICLVFLGITCEIDHITHRVKNERKAIFLWTKQVIQQPVINK